MSYASVLDLISIVLTAPFIAALVSAMLLQGRRATLRQLALATRLYRAATALAALKTLVYILNAATAGVWWILIYLTLTALLVHATTLVRRRRDAQGEQVVADAERVVRDFRQQGQV